VGRVDENGRAQTGWVMDALNTTMMVEEPNGSEPRKSRIVPAARWVTIDYRSIVANAVAGLAKNTPDARRDVYAEARGVVHRHLQLMRLPEPIIEIEKLALDLTIRKIERQTRAEQALAAEKRKEDEEQEGPAGEAAEPTLNDAVRSFGSALAEVSQAFTSLLIVLGLRPIFYGLWIAAAPLRFVGRAIISPVGLAAGLPIAALLVITIYLLDSDAGFQSGVSMRAANFLEHVDTWLNGRTPSAAGKDETRIAGIEPAPGETAHAVPARARVTGSSHGHVASAPSSEIDGLVARARQPASFATASADRMEISNGIPKWFNGYANLVEAGPALSSKSSSTKSSFTKSSSTKSSNSSESVPEPPPDEADVVASAAISPAAPSTTLASANSMAAIPDDRPVITLTPLRNPAPKAAALIESGRKAAAADDLEKAVQDFTEAARIDPAYPGSYTERAQALFKLGETDRAITDYSAALKRDPNFGPALRGRAMANLYRGGTEVALADLSRAIQIAEIDPNRLPPIELFYARRSRANIYGTKMQPEGEIADCTALVESYKRDKTLNTALVGVYQTEGAANLIATIYRQRANAYIRQGKSELARADLTAAVPLSADRGFSALVDRARLNEAIGQRDQAIADLQAALAIRPGSDEARIALRRISSGVPQARPSGRT
jgi:tetratricopeptide (TPR) repeat protein